MNRIILPFREKWLPVVSYEGFYEVSNYGRVRSINRDVYNNGSGLWNHRVGKLLAMTPGGRGGYLRVDLSKDGKHRTSMVSVLVAKAFIPNPCMKPFVNHIDGFILNNFVTNLEWCTQSENQLHAYRTGLQVSAYGEDHYAAKLTDLDVRNIRKRVANGETQKSVSIDYDLASGHMSRICSRKSWSHVA